MSLLRPSAAWLLSLLSVLGLVGLLNARSTDVITVCPVDCDYRTLPPAMDAAPSGGIIAVGPGVYTGTVHIEDSLTIIGAGSLSTTLDGAGQGPVLVIRSSTAVTIAHLTISNGLALVVEGHARGGGIYNLGDLHLLDVIIANNTARATPGPDDAYNGDAHGGGIFNGCEADHCGQLWLEDTMVANNLARGSDNTGDQDAGDAHGGGLFNDCSAVACAGLIVSGSIFSGNVAQGGNANWPYNLPVLHSGQGYGGAIAISCDESGCTVAQSNELHLVDSILRGNRAAGNRDCDGSDGLGGGILNLGRLAVERTTIDANRTIRGYPQCVPGYGRPVYPQGGGIFNGGDLLINSSTVSNNTTQGHGGGIVNAAGGRARVVNSTVSDNAVGNSNGGGILNQGQLDLYYATIAGNSAVGGVRNWREGGGLKNTGTVSTTASTISGNRAYNYEMGDRGPDCWGSLHLQGYNHIGDATDCELLGRSPSDIIDSEALLHSLEDNGGPTLTRAPSIFSPLLNAADPLHCPAADQRGFPRPSEEGGRCDIGAVEGYKPLDQIIYLVMIANQ